MHPLMQVIWGHTWKHTLEKSQTNATCVTMHHLRQVIWGHTWKNTLEKSRTNVTSVTLPALTQVLWGDILRDTDQCRKDKSHNYLSLCKSITNFEIRIPIDEINCFNFWRAKNSFGRDKINSQSFRCVEYASQKYAFNKYTLMMKMMSMNPEDLAIAIAEDLAIAKSWYFPRKHLAGPPPSKCDKTIY